MDSKSERAKRVILDYAVRHNCWKTFDALYSEDMKAKLPRVALALFCISRVIKEDEVEKFEVAMAILYRIYTAHSGEIDCSFGVYWKLILELKVKVVLKSAEKESNKLFLQKLRDLLTSEDVLLPTKNEEELKEVKQRLWILYRGLFKLISCPDRREYVTDLGDFVSAVKTNMLMKQFSSSILDTFPPCDLEQVMKQMHPSTQLIVLTDEALMKMLGNSEEMERLNSALSFIESEEQSHDVTHRNSHNNEKFSQASLAWNRNRDTDDALSLIVPSVTEGDSVAQLSDLENEDLEFKDNNIMGTPDLNRFLKSSLE